MVNIILENIKKIYPNGFEAIKGDGISIDIQTGEFIAILGPSGCGKSSLLRMVAGLEEITSGNLIINDKIINNLEPAKRNVAMVFQNYALYPHMTVYQNLSYGLKNLKVPKNEIIERISKVASNLHIEHLLERKPHELSGGQRQRVAMGRAIVRKPDYFLFDEPLSNLDARLRIKIRQDIEKLQKELQITTLYVTHDQVEAMAMADRIVVMNEGDVLQIGTPQELYNTPKTLFVATFIGSDTINIFPVEKKDNNLKVLNHDVNFSCIKADTLNNAKTIAIRPEHVAINPHKGYLTLESIIENIEYLGTYGLCYVTINDVKMCIRIRNQYLDKISLDDVLTLYINPENIMAFNDNKKYIGSL